MITDLYLNTMHERCRITNTKTGSNTKSLPKYKWAATWQNRQNGMCAKSDQSLCCFMKKAWVLSYPLSAQRMPRLIWVFAGRTIILLVLSWDGQSNENWCSSLTSENDQLNLCLVSTVHVRGWLIRPILALNYVANRVGQFWRWRLCSGFALFTPLSSLAESRLPPFW